MPQGKKSLTTRQDTKSYHVEEGGVKVSFLFYTYYQNLLSLMKEDGSYFQLIDRLKWQSIFN